MKNIDRSLVHLPISIFAVVLGFSGAAIAVEKITPFFKWTEFISIATCFVAATIFLLLLFLYTYKIIYYPAEVRKEFFHPVKIAFFPTITISFLLLSIAVFSHSSDLSFLLWVIGAIGHLLLTLVIISIWIQKTHFDVPHMNPAWFIPVVGNIIVPIVGVAHAPLFISWFFFSVGFIFWLNLMAIFFNRIIFHHPLPDKLLPTLCILIAPPAIGFISLVKLQGEVTDAAMMLYYLAVFFLMLMLMQANLFLKIKFYLSWWAYSFPLAAFTIATTLLAEHNNHYGLALIAKLCFFFLIGVITLLTIKTFYAIKHKEICVAEE